METKQCIDEIPWWVVLYPDLLIHSALQRHNIKGRRMKKGSRKTSLQLYLPLTLLQDFERVVQGLHMRGC